MKLAEYLTYLPPAGMRDELIHGTAILSPSPRRRHADLCSSMYDLLKPKLHPEFIVRLDTTCLLGEIEGPRPDVFVISRERWIEADASDGYPEGSPELPIEVWSESNTESEMAIKRSLYLSDQRCQEVWEVKPDAMQLVRHGRNASHFFTPGESVPIPPGIGSGFITIQELFSGIVS